MEQNSEAKFPNLTLPEKNGAETGAGATLPLEAGKAPASSHITVAGASPWKTGDLVLAPQGPTFLHVGTLGQIADGAAFVEFLTGESELITLDRLRPATFAPGQEVHYRLSHDGLVWYAAATVVEERAATLVVLPTGASEETCVALQTVGVPLQPLGPYYQTVRHFVTEEFAATLKCGDPVWAPADPGTLYAAAVDKIQGNDVHVRYHASEHFAWVKLPQLLPLALTPGMKLLARWKDEAAYHPAEVDAVEDDRVLVRYLDGSESWTSLAALAVTRTPFGPMAWVSRSPDDRFPVRPFLAYLLFLVLILVWLALSWRPS